MPKIPTYTAPIKHSYCRTLKELAKLTGMSYRTLEKWKTEGLISPTATGKWSTRAVATIVERREADAEDSEIAGIAKSPWLEKLREHRAKIAELELKERRGELLEREVVIASWIAREKAMKGAMLRLPKEMKHKLIALEPDEIEARLFDAVAKALNHLAESNLEGAT